MKKFTSVLALALMGVASMYAAEELQVIKSYTFDEPKTITKDWSTEINIPKSLFADATEGCVVRFHFSDYPEGSQVQIATKDTQWTWTQLNDYDDITGETLDFSLASAAEFAEITEAEVIEYLQFAGMILKGQSFTISGADLLGKAGDVPVPVEYVTLNDYVLDAPATLSWSKEVHIPKSAFKGVTNECVVRVNFTDVKAGDQVQYAVKDEGWTWTQLNDYDDIDDVAFDINIAKMTEVTPDEMVADLLWDGLYLKGAGTVTGVTVLAPKGGDTPVGPGTELAVISTYTFDPVAETGNWGKEINIPASAFADATLEATIRLNFDGTAPDDAQIQPVVKVGAGWTWTELAQYEDVGGEKAFEFDMNTYAEKVESATLLSTLKERGMILKGKNASIKSVEVLLPADDIVEYELVNAYTVASPSPIAAWSGEVHIAKAEFDKVCDKSKIELCFTDCEGGQIQPVVKVGADYTWTELQQYVDLSGETFVIKVDELASFTDALTADEFIEALHNDGFYMKGQKFTFTGMNLYNPKTDGISAPVADDNAIDFNAPVEIYNLQGIRVNEMSAGNLYILRQGNKVAKVIK